jgi:hypothetical protein
MEQVFRRMSRHPGMTKKTLSLRTETIRILDTRELRQAAGGTLYYYNYQPLVFSQTQNVVGSLPASSVGATTLCKL